MKLKKIMATVISVAMMISCVNLTAFAADPIAATIGNVEYASFEEALTSAKSGDTIHLKKGEHALVRGNLNEGRYWLPENLTIIGEDGAVVTNGPAISAKSITVDNVDFINPTMSGYNSGLVFHLSGDSSISNSTINGYWGGSYYSTASGTLKIDNCVVNSYVYGLHIAEGIADVTVTNSKIYGWNTYGADINITFDNCKFAGNGNYAFLGFYNDATMKDCTFSDDMEIGVQTSNEIEISLSDCDIIDSNGNPSNKDFTDLIPESEVYNATIIVDGVDLYGYVAPELPSATVSEALVNTTVQACDFDNLNNVKATPLTFQMNFKADEPTDAQREYYSDWLADYELVINKDVRGVDGYLAGQYDSFFENWIKLGADTEDVVLPANKPIKIIKDIMGLELEYEADILGWVKDFDCGIYLTPEFIATNEDLQITLSLKLYNPENIEESYVIGESYNFDAQDASPAYVAQIGDAKFLSIQSAFDSAKSGDTVKLIDNVELEAPITVDNTVTLDLNGKTISGTHGTDYSMIHVLNGADLTVKDTTTEKNGKITYAAGGNNTGAAVWVEGKLTLESGTIEVTGAWSLGFAVDLRPNAWGTAHTVGASFVMNGGTVKSTDTAVRVASNSSDSYPELGVSFTMNGGSIDSDWDAIFVQHLYAGDLNINVVNGTVSGTNSAMRIYGNAGSDIDMNVTGGNFNGDIKVADAYKDADAIAISGGTFAGIDPAGVDANFCKDGYTSTLNADGTYSVARTSIFGVALYVPDMTPVVQSTYRVGIFAGIDSLMYKEVGFRVYHNNRLIGEGSTTSVYKSITAGGMTAKALDYNVYRFFGIPVDFHTGYDNLSGITFQPYAIDLTGKTIVGGKYRIEDIYTKTPKAQEVS